MTKVTHVTKAQESKVTRSCHKCGKVIQPGESYFWWSVMRNGRGFKQYGCPEHRPTVKDLTQSEFKRSLIDIEETRDQAGQDLRDGSITLEDYAEVIRNMGIDFQNLADDCGEKVSNMPEGLQESRTGELLNTRKDECEERVSACEDAACTIENFELADLESWKDYAPQNCIDKEEGESEEDFEERVKSQISEDNEGILEDAVQAGEEVDIDIE